MFDPTLEPPIRLSQARLLSVIPRGTNGKPLHLTTLLNWCTNGLRRPGGEIVKLEHRRCGGAVCTSEQALVRFFDRLSTQPGEVVPPSERERTAAKARAKALLDAAGV